MTDFDRRPARAMEIKSFRSDTLPSLSLPEATALAKVAEAHSAPTQVRQPWRTTIRSAFQFTVALAALVPFLIDALGIDKAAPIVAGLIGVAATITRLMAVPQVDDFLQAHLPWLAAKPSGGAR